MSAAKATGSAWKLPPDSAASSSAKISGLSVTPLASSASVARRLAQQVEHGAHHLRLAAQAIGILHARVAGEMRSADRAARHQRPQAPPATSIWPRWRRKRVDARIERRVGAARGVGRQRAGRPAPRETALRLEQRRQRMGGRELRAVEQRQPLLRRRARSARGRPRRALRPPADARRRSAPRRRRSSPPPYARAARGRPRRRPSLAPARPASRPRASIASSSRSVSSRTPEAPWARLASFSAIISRVVATGVALADPGGVRQHDVALQLGEIGVGDAHARRACRSRC